MKYEVCAHCEGFGIFYIEYYHYMTDFCVNEGFKRSNNKSYIRYHRKCPICFGKGFVDWVTALTSDFRDVQMEYLIKQQRNGEIFDLKIELVSAEERRLKPEYFGGLMGKYRANY